MIGVALLAAAVAAAAPSAPPPGVLPAAPPVAAPPRPSFAAALAAAPPITGPAGWVRIGHAAAWAALAAAIPATRPAARWAYARSLIGDGRGPEARAVLDTMLAADVDLGASDTFRLALGAARAEAGDAKGALAALGDAPGTGPLATNPEACAWRLWARTMLDQPGPALAEVRCALPALNARTPAARAPFLYAGARAALAAGRPAAVTPWLRALPDGDAGANLFRARAALAQGDVAAARARLARVAGGSAAQQADARVTRLEADLATRRATAADIAAIDHLALAWRGDAVEQRVLRLGYRIGGERHDLRRTLAAGATLLRYFQLGPAAAPLLAEVQATLAAGLAPGSAVPLGEAAGLFWEYRDLTPAGSEGDLLASRLADRLAAQGLFLRAADLLRHQLLERARDVAQGPLSTRVASLYLLAGAPTAALAAIRDTDGNAYPAAMQWDRHRVEAVALYKLGRRQEALAALQDVPGGGPVRAEMFWQAHDWQRLVGETAALLPSGRAPSAVEQVVVLRHAIALAMLGREPALRQLRERYAAVLRGLPAAATFDLLTRDPATLDADALTAAMFALPAASPAGPLGDLFDVAVTEPRAPPRPAPT